MYTHYCARWFEKCGGNCSAWLGSTVKWLGALIEGVEKNSCGGGGDFWYGLPRVVLYLYICHVLLHSIHDLSKVYKYKNSEVNLVRGGGGDTVQWGKGWSVSFGLHIAQFGCGTHIIVCSVKVLFTPAPIWRCGGGGRRCQGYPSSGNTITTQPSKEPVWQ